MACGSCRKKRSQTDDEGDDGGEGDAARAGVGRRARVGDHEEGEDQERPALELVERNREGVAEPERPGDEQPGVAPEETERDVGAPGPLEHEAAGARDEEREERRRTPLAGRGPGPVGRGEQDHEREVRRVEEVLAPPAERELAPDGDRGRGRREPELARAEEQAEREPAHEGAPGLEGTALEPPVEGGLQGESHPEERRRGRGIDPEAEGDLPEQEERRQHGDLVVAGVDGPGCHAAEATATGALRAPNRPDLRGRLRRPARLRPARRSGPLTAAPAVLIRCWLRRRRGQGFPPGRPAPHAGPHHFPRRQAE